MSSGDLFSLGIQWIANDELINRLLNDWRQRGSCGLILTRPGSRMIRCRQVPLDANPPPSRHASPAMVLFSRNMKVRQ